MAERLAGGNVAIALLANTLATVGGLYVLIEVFGPDQRRALQSGGLAGDDLRGELPASACSRRTSSLSWSVRVLGAWLAHAMFDMTILQFSTKVRSGTGQWIAEAVATFGLVLVILRAPAARVAAMVAAYIGAAYWFTASTSFANPAAVRTNVHRQLRRHRTDERPGLHGRGAGRGPGGSCRCSCLESRLGLARFRVSGRAEAPHTGPRIAKGGVDRNGLDPWPD